MEKCFALDIFLLKYSGFQKDEKIGNQIYCKHEISRCGEWFLQSIKCLGVHASFAKRHSVHASENMIALQLQSKQPGKRMQPIFVNIRVIRLTYLLAR